MNRTWEGRYGDIENDNGLDHFISEIRRHLTSTIRYCEAEYSWSQEVKAPKTSVIVLEEEIVLIWALPF